MRDTVAKRLRREARKVSKPTEYNTTQFKRWTHKFDDKGNPVMDFRGTVTCTGYRAAYLKLKHDYKAA